MSIIPIVSALLNDTYRLNGASLHPTSGGSEGDKPVFIVRHGDTRYIVRVYPPENTRSDVDALVRVLRLLEKADYPAERLIPTREGASMTEAEGFRLVLTAFVEGIPTDRNLSLPILYRLGEILGRLHTQFAPDVLIAHGVPVAERNVQAEMQMALDDLAEVASIPPSFEAYHAELVTAIDAVERCADLPDVLIHNDFQPGNILLTPDDSLRVIDWDGAGRSPAIVDLGYLISSVHPPGAPRPDAARIHAIVDGYSQQRTLSSAELDRLPDVICFRPLTYLASDFAAYIAGVRDPSYLDALAAYRTADEAADLVRARVKHST